MGEVSPEKLAELREYYDNTSTADAMGVDEEDTTTKEKLMPNLTPAQRRKAKEKLARDRGISAESITDESVDLALANSSILLSDIISPSGIDSYNTPVDSPSSSSFDAGSSSFDSGSSGGGCD